MHWVGQNWAFREKGIHPAGVEQRVGTPEVFIQSKCVKGFGGSRAVLLGRTTDLPLRSGHRRLEAELLQESWYGG